MRDALSWGMRRRIASTFGITALGACLMLVAACADAREPSRPGQQPSAVARLADDLARRSYDPLVDVPDPIADPSGPSGPDACELAVEQDGPCSLACDNAAVLEEFVAAGTCMIFECELVTGDHVRIGGCR